MLNKYTKKNKNFLLSILFCAFFMAFTKPVNAQNRSVLTMFFSLAIVINIQKNTLVGIFLDETKLKGQKITSSQIKKIHID